MPLLDITNLDVTFPVRESIIKPVQDFSLSLEAGERIGIVGESGAGKSMVAFAILNLISPPGRIGGGEIIFEGQSLTRLSPEALRHIRGERIAMIFQDPMMTLNPVLTIGAQMVETLLAHRPITYAKAKALAIEKLNEVRIPSPETRFDGYPHELSGGLRQRVVIAIALMMRPSIIIADEPTTALDVTIQAEILALLLELCKTHSTALILITHDLAVVSQVTEKIVVMYAGRIVETGPTEQIVYAPRHPYSRGLLAALPERNQPGTPLAQIKGTMPQPYALPPGCAFAPRCALADQLCNETRPELCAEGGRHIACHHAQSWPAGA